MTPNQGDYIRLGWKIFPVHFIKEGGLCSCGRNTPGAQDECKAKGKHPMIRDGVNGASNDIEVVRAWWAQFPGCNWGVACGKASGIIVIDIDPRKGGYESFEEYEQSRRDTGDFGDTLLAKSGGNGKHIYIEYPEGSTIGNRVNWLPGVDIRSNGGYVVLPPSNHLSGGFYEWLNWGHPIAPAPPDFVARVSSGGQGGLSQSTLGKTDELLGGIEEGSRDDSLFRMACRFRRQLGDNRDAVTLLVLAAARNAKPPFPESEALIKVEQAFKQVHEEVDAIFGGAGDGGGGDDDDDAPEEAPLSRLTDMGNRDRFVRAYGDDFRYVVGIGWHQWADDGWRRVDDLVPHRQAQQVPAMIRQDAMQVADITTRAKFMRWANDTESSARIAAIVTLAKGHETMMKTPDDFDSEPHLLACRNGMVNLENGSIRYFERDDLFTRNTRVLYDPDFVYEPWEKFLVDVTEGDKELQTYLQMSAGYTLTGSVAEESFFIVSGPTASGKSTYTDGLMTALGGYADTTDADTFMKRYGKDAPREELVKMAGARMIGTEELPEGERFDDALLKRVTGGSRLSARFLYQESFTFMPQFKLWMATNHDPVTSDSAMFRRIKRVPFLHQIPEDKRDRKLKEAIKNPEIGGRAVLAWAVKGARAYFEAGRLETPMAVTWATNAYQAEQDSFTHFINETFHVEEGKELSIRIVYGLYTEWCKTANERPMRRPQFIQKLQERKINVSMKDNQDRFTIGLGVRHDVVTPFI